MVHEGVYSSSPVFSSGDCLVCYTNAAIYPCGDLLIGKWFTFSPSLQQLEFIIPAISSSLVLPFVNLGDLNLIRLQEEAMSQVWQKLGQSLSAIKNIKYSSCCLLCSVHKIWPELGPQTGSEDILYWHQSQPVQSHNCGGCQEPFIQMGIFLFPLIPLAVPSS